jgi:hypothetical protein
MISKSHTHTQNIKFVSFIIFFIFLSSELHKKKVFYYFKNPVICCRCHWILWIVFFGRRRIERWTKRKSKRQKKSNILAFDNGFREQKSKLESFELQFSNIFYCFSVVQWHWINSFSLWNVQIEFFILLKLSCSSLSSLFFLKIVQCTPLTRTRELWDLLVWIYKMKRKWLVVGKSFAVGNR